MSDKYKELLFDIKNKKYKCISFDMFDTLVKRTVQKPEDIFDLVQLKYNRTYNQNIKNFRKKRIKAECNARNYKKKEDITLDEIYKYIDINNNEKKLFKQIEIEVEIETLIPNQEIIDILKYCNSINKYIIITSDMYLPKKVLRDMLEKIGIDEGLYNSIYVSGEIGLTKMSGNIWGYIEKELEKYNIYKENILHIGDNFVSDFKNVIFNGIKAFHIKDEKKYNNLYCDIKFRNIEENHLAFSIINSLPDNNRSYYSLGYSFLGPVLYNYCYWLHNNKDKYDKIMFTAREGYLIKKIYEIMYPEDSHLLGYIRINKNILRAPALYIDASLERFIDLIPSQKDYSIKQILEYMEINLNDKKILQLLRRYGYNINDRLKRNTLTDNEKFKEFFKECTNYARHIWKEQYECLIKYLSQNDFDGKVALVNNSIKGTAQKYLCEIFDYNKKATEILGIHFIISIDGMKKIKNKCLVWFNDECNQFKKRIFALYCLVIEHLLFEPEGTALSLFEKEGNINVICEDHNIESCNDDKINELQFGAIKFVEFYNKIMPLYVGERYILDTINSFLLFPKYEDAKLISKIIDFDNGKVRYFAEKTKNNSLFEKISILIKNKEIQWPQSFLSLNKSSRFGLLLYKNYFKIRFVLKKKEIW